MATILEQGFEAQARSLREFGYPGVTAEMVSAAHADWKTGKASAGEPADVIARFCESAFEEHPQIFGTPEVA
jgi:hypothetical protein